MDETIQENALEPGKKIQCLNAVHLKVLACIFMLLDHSWLTFFSTEHGFDWMTCLGRIAFPIFAFQLVEGFVHTHDLKKYLGRMLLFAVIAEIPFNFMCGGKMSYLRHQNVMFTFFLALICMFALEKAKKHGNKVFVPTTILVLIVGYIVGELSAVDYGGYGIWMVLLFYIARNTRHEKIIQLAGVFYLNSFLIYSRALPVTLAGITFSIPEQAFAVLGLIFIWLYNGKPGSKNKAIQYGCYAFYPIHMIVLDLIKMI